MILDRLDNAQQYFSLHAGFWKAFRYLAETDFDKLEDGTHQIEPGRLFVIVAQDAARGENKAILESHRKYIDIQYTISGHERIGWQAVGDCDATTAFDSGRDLQFYDNRPRQWVDIPADHFAVFFPNDAHAPLAGDQSPRKAVVKVAVTW